MKSWLIGIAVAIAGALLIAMGLVAPVPSHAHKGAKGIVMERMMAMKGIAKGMKSIAGMVRGKALFDGATVKSSAGAIKEHASRIPQLFPKGSIKGPSEATPNIWTDWKTFEASANDLARYAGQLQSDASNDAGSTKGIFDKMRKTCSACHKTFRKKKRK